MIKIISGVILYIFAIIGVTVLSIALHEQSHINDMKDINAEFKEVCYVGYDTENTAGWYKYTLPDKTVEQDRIDFVDKYTEIKAYTISALIFVLFNICALSFFTYRERR